MPVRSLRNPQQSGSVESQEASTSSTQPVLGNALVQSLITDEQGPQEDPIARLFQRIAPESDSASFGSSHLKEYLDDDLQFAEGEWFRGTKLNGATEGLMEQLDGDKNGSVASAEFEGFRDTVMEAVVPGLAPDASNEQVTEAAQLLFAKLDGAQGDGKLTLAEIQAMAKAMLPEDTSNKDLVAQLGARVAIDAVDTDQTDEDVADRTLSSDEWITAAIQLQQARRKTPQS